MAAHSAQFSRAAPWVNTLRPWEVVFAGHFTTASALRGKPSAPEIATESMVVDSSGMS